MEKKQTFFMAIFIGIVLLASLTISGCSVGMAMSGKKDPNLGMVRVGSTRGEVELTLGSPVKSVTLDRGNRMDVYQYEIGNEPSSGRAIGHGLMDVLTLGLWEVIGTPIEAVQGEKYELTITYGKDDRVQKINSPDRVTNQKQSRDNNDL